MPWLVGLLLMGVRGDIGWNRRSLIEQLVRESGTGIQVYLGFEGKKVEVYE